MHLLPPPQQHAPCISLIGMPGAGKSTLGSFLAQRLGWALVDTDYLIESAYGAPLQSITEAMDKEAFLDLENVIVSSLRANRAILATGGSVVYRETAMRRLQELGPVVYLHLSLATVEERVARNPRRGIAIAPHQTLADIYTERRALYERYATITIPTEGVTPQDCAGHLLAELNAIGFSLE